MPKKSSVPKAAMFLSLVIIMSKFIGFAREAVMANIYGTTAISDAITMATTIDALIFSGFAIAMSTSYMPIYAEIRKTSFKKASLFTSNVLNIGSVLIFIFSITTIFFLRPIIQLTTGFNEKTIEMTVQIGRIVLIGSCFMVVTRIATGFLNSNDHYFAAGLQSIVYNAIVISTLFLTKNNLTMLGFGFMLSTVVPGLALLLFAKHCGLRYSLEFNLRDHHMSQLLKMSIPIFIGVAAESFNQIVDRYFATRVSVGTMSALKYADLLISFINSIFAVSLSTVLFTKFSNLAAKKDIKSFKDILFKSMNMIIVIMIPITALTICLAQPIVRILFQRGEFNTQSTLVTYQSMIFYSLGLVGMGFFAILNRAFYSLKDSIAPIRAFAIGLGFNILFDWLLYKPYGHSGLAFATSMSFTIMMILMLFELKRKIGHLGIGRLLPTVGKSTLASCAMFAVCYLFYSSIPQIFGSSFSGSFGGTIFAIGLTGMLGLTIYSLLIILFKVRDLDMITDIIKRKILRRK